MRQTVCTLIAVSLITFLLCGCGGAVVTSPLGGGMVYTQVKAPTTICETSDVGLKKVGRSFCISVLGVIVIGDASINAAMKNGNITKIHHVDYSVMNILGCYSRYQTVVYGE